MTREADRDLAARLKARLASAALRGERTPAELAEQFRRIDEWTRQLEQGHSSPAAPSEASATLAPPVANPPAPERVTAAAPPMRPVMPRAAPAARVPTLPAILQTPAVPRMPVRERASTLPQMLRQPAALRMPAREKAPTLPTILAAPAAPQMPPRPRAPTLPAMRPPTPAATRPATLSQAIARAKVPTLPVFQGQPQWPEVPQSPTWPQPPLADTLDDDFWEHQPAGGAPVQAEDGSASASSRRDAPAPARARRRFRSFFVGWRERHHAARTSRQLLKLHREVAANHPHLGGQELYRMIVMAHMGGTVQAADAVLARAAESFATWPVERALRFRDVVHYLAVSDYLGIDAELAEWTRENLGHVVAEFVPDTM
jgi:hypothetical protein